MEFLWVCTVSFIFHRDVIAYVILPLQYRLYFRAWNESFPHALTLGGGEGYRSGGRLIRDPTHHDG